MPCSSSAPLLSAGQDALTAIREETERRAKRQALTPEEPDEFLEEGHSILAEVAPTFRDHDMLSQLVVATAVIHLVQLSLNLGTHIAFWFSSGKGDACDLGELRRHLAAIN